MNLLVALVLQWTVPVCNATGICSPDLPAECVEAAVLWVPRRAEICQATSSRWVVDRLYRTIECEPWWAAPTVYDTLTKIPVRDGEDRGYILPLWVTEGTCIVIHRDSSYNWSGHSNYEVSWR